MNHERDSDAPVGVFDHYHCVPCAVTFREPFPVYYDLTPCPACGYASENVGLDAVHEPVLLR